LMNVLLCGPLPPPLGGTTVLFDSLARALSSRDDVDVRVVGTGGVRGRGTGGLARLLGLRRRIARGLRGADVAALHVSTSGLHVMGPVFARLCSRAGTPFIVRKFGGTDFMDYPPHRRALILSSLRRAHLYLAETRALVAAAEREGLANARWYPNSRAMPELPEDDDAGRRCRRFVYLGQIHRTKGVRELIAAGESLAVEGPAGIGPGGGEPGGDAPTGGEPGGGAVVDFYGTLGHDVAASEFDGLARVRYRGSVEPSAVHEVLSGYDALVLPSYHEGEGYPGAVLEAYGAGLPVIATRWRALPEIVDDSCGVLVEPRDAESLRSAMESLARDPGEYARLRRGVRARRGAFADDVWQERFVEFCREIGGLGARAGS
jgi:glycosyltransferase involved in cell wall biosynthesis